MTKIKAANVEEIPIHNGQHVTKVAFANGAVGWLASSVPDGALQGLMRKLVRKQKRLEKNKKSAEF